MAESKLTFTLANVQHRVLCKRTSQQKQTLQKQLPINRKTHCKKLKQEITITSFRAEHQNEINTMMESIALEFDEPIFTTQSKKIAEASKSSNNKFWVATNGFKVVGTIGLIKLLNNNLALKSMFVDKVFRGQGISNLLLDTLINWTFHNNYNQIYLGTMTQFKAAQKFYEKKGFTKCNQTELPTDFVINKLDAIFYTKHLD